MDRTLAEMITAQLVRVSKDTNLFLSSKRPLGIGDPVSSSLAIHKYKNFRPVEIVFEEVRRRQFPDRPSRIGAKYLFATEAGARAWKGGRHVYRVEVSGPVFFTDMNYYTEAGWRPEHADSWAEQYWEGVKRPKPDATGWQAKLVEALTHGTVRVVEAL